MDIIISFSFKTLIWMLVEDGVMLYTSKTDAILKSLADLDNYKQLNEISIDRVFLDIGPGFHTGLRAASVFAKTIHVDQNIPLYSFSWVDCYVLNGRTICFITNRELFIYGRDVEFQCEFTMEAFRLMSQEYNIDGVFVGAHNIVKQLGSDHKVLTDQTVVMSQYYSAVSKLLNSHQEVKLRYK